MTRKLSKPTLFAFGIGQASEGFKNQAFNVFLLFYYNQVVGISGTATGLALGIALLFDAVTDPIAGAVSDRFKSRWGRRHPFIFISAFPLVICFVALFNPPEFASETSYFIWLTVFAIGVRTALTFYHVPHLALGAEITHDYNQRSSAYAIGVVCSIMAMAMVSVIGYRYFFPTTDKFNPGTLNPEGYESFSLFFATLMFIAIMWCFFGTRKEIPYMRDFSSATQLTLRNVLRDFADVFKNASFRLIFFGMLLTTYAIAAEAVLSPYMGVHFWGLPTEQLGLVSLGTVIGLLIGLPLTPFITAKLGKKRALVYPAIIVVCNANLVLLPRLAGAEWFPSNDSPVIFWVYFARYLVQAICFPVILASFNSMFADIADELELQTGKRAEGAIFATRSFSNKLVAGLGTLTGGFIIDLIAFPRGAALGEVPAETIWWLGFYEGPVAFGISLLGVLFYLRYRIDKQRHAEIMAAIEARKAVDSASNAPAG